jgi:DNA-binding winged helix-turn-helix (wHTH) protein
MALDLANEVLKGHYRVVANAVTDQPSLLNDLGNLPYAVASAVFLGDQERADVMARREDLSLEQTVACRFFLALGLTRRSEYKKARSLLALNARVARRESCPRTVFYVHQGLAFYRFFCGRYLLAQSHAHKAYAAAMQAQFPWGEIVSRDLLGHAAIQTGEVHLGMKHLGGAREMAQKAGNTTVTSAILITQVRVSAQFGLHPENCINELTKALAALPPEDTYSRGELDLELARQLMLRGEIDRAREVLDNSCDFIYKNQNRRQAATLNLRYGYLMHLEGQHQQALHLIRVAENNVDREVDRLHLQQLRGLRSKIERHLGRIEDAKKNEALIEQDALLLGNAVNARIISRRHEVAFEARTGEDPLGDLLDQVRRKDQAALPEVISAGYFGLLQSFFDLPYGVKALIFDLIPGSLTVLGPGTVRYHEKQVNGLIRRMIQTLKGRAVSKEDLIHEVWGYHYDPARHDSIAHAGLTKLRRLLEPFGNWIQLTEDGYRFDSEVQIIFHGSARKKISEVADKAASVSPALKLFAAALLPIAFEEDETEVTQSHAREPIVVGKSIDLGLNFRQIQILERLAEARSMSVAECAGHFRTSKITACRDLTFLAENDHCLRIGKGRATRYMLQSKEVESELGGLS